jgi:hypothetical protein
MLKDVKQLFFNKSESKKDKQQNKRKERRLRLTKIQGSDLEKRHNNTVQNPDESSTFYFNYICFGLARINRCKFEDHLSIVLNELLTVKQVP